LNDSSANAKAEGAAVDLIRCPTHQEFVKSNAPLDGERSGFIDKRTPNKKRQRLGDATVIMGRDMLPLSLTIGGLTGGMLVAAANFIFYAWILPEVNASLGQPRRSRHSWSIFECWISFANTLTWLPFQGIERRCTSSLDWACSVCLLDFFSVFR
jgi:hypothetical protein